MCYIDIVGKENKGNTSLLKYTKGLVQCIGSFLYGRKMSMLCGLIIAWILTLFNFDEICITAMRELFNVEISIATYYFIFAILGWIFD